MIGHNKLAFRFIYFLNANANLLKLFKYARGSFRIYVQYECKCFITKYWAFNLHLFLVLIQSHTNFLKMS